MKTSWSEQDELTAGNRPYACTSVSAGKIGKSILLTDDDPTDYKTVVNSLLSGSFLNQILFSFSSDKDVFFFSSDLAVSSSIFVGAEREENLTKTAFLLDGPTV